MFAYAQIVAASLLRRLLNAASAPETAIAICYGAGLIASRLVGDGAAGHPVVAMGAPIAVGMLLRMGRGLNIRDAAGIIIMHLAVSLLFGLRPEEASWTLARNLVEIGGGSLIFIKLRAAGVLKSPLRVAAAAGMVACAAPLLALPLDVLSHWPPSSWQAVAARWLADCVSMGLILGIILTYGRAAGLVARIEPSADEPSARPWEFVLAGLLVGGLVLGAISEERPMATLGASVGLLWFALRLGPFATTVAAFSFATALLSFAGEGRWPILFEVSTPLESELLRYLAIALLAAPSVAVAAFVHDQNRLRRMFAYRATHDGLTTLVNRSRFLETLEGAAIAAERSRGRRFALFLIDLDYFKSVNDTYGHARGDQLLVEVASRLRASVRATDLVARIGGDEFAVVAPVPSVADAARLARRLVETVHQACDLNGVPVWPSVTVGGVLAPDNSTDPQHLMLLADDALYEAKAAGRNCWRFASDDKPARLTVPAQHSVGQLVHGTETVLLD